MDKVRIGIIGFGRMGLTHYSIINTHPAVEMTAIADTSSTMLNMIKKYLPGVTMFEDYKNLINSGLVDGIIVCTPSFLHHPVCKMACEKGIAVFCEKPFTTDPKLAYELADMFEAKGIVNQVGYVNRFDPVWNTVKDYMQKGLIGKVGHVNAQFYSATITASQKKEGWRSKRENGGGATYEMGAHIIDLMEYFFGKPEKLYGSILDYIYNNSVEDVCSAEIGYPNDVNVSLHVDWSDFTYRKPMMKVDIMGDKGKILADFYGYKVFLREDSAELGLQKGWTTVPMNMIPVKAAYYVRGVGFTNQLYTFADAILENKKAEGCSFREAADSQELIHGIFENDKR
jgi:predicted dehydrogenase